MRQLLDRRLPWDIISESCRKIMPFRMSETSEETNIWSRCKSSLANTSSRLPRAQYVVKMITDP